MRKLVTTLAILAVIVLALAAFFVYRYINPSISNNEESLIGIVSSVSSDGHAIILEVEDRGKITVIVTPETKLRDEGGRVLEFSAIRPGDTVQTRGTFANDVSFTANEILVIEKEKLAEYRNETFNVRFKYPASWQPNSEAPYAGSVPVRYEGEVGFFHVDATGSGGADISAVAQSIASHTLLPYGTSPIISAHSVGDADARLILPSSDQPAEMKDEAALIVRYPAAVNISGTQFDFFVLYAHKDYMPLFMDTLEFLSRDVEVVRIHFARSSGAGRDPGDCEATDETERTVAQSAQIETVALENLLQGPTEAERREGLFTNIPSGVRINSLTIENGIARADFSAELDRGVAGSCRVLAIRAQIEHTLKEFPSVSEVVISIEGRTDDILQP